MLQQGVTVLVDRHPPCRNVAINFTFTLLPALGPKPSLIGGDGQRRPELQYAVVALGDLHLRTRLVQM